MVTSVPPDAPRRRSYHHGHLRQALIEAALTLARQKGPEGVSVREAARLLGVSPAAPFRHFPNRRALMTAVAEEASTRLTIEVRKALAREKGSALARLRAVGTGYLRWASHHPAHFRIVSARDQIDLDQSAALQGSMDQVREIATDLLREAQGAGQLDSALDPVQLALLARATVYGIARMQLDGHYPQWGVGSADEARAMSGLLDLLIRLMAGSTRPG